MTNPAAPKTFSAVIAAALAADKLTGTSYSIVAGMALEADRLHEQLVRDSADMATKFATFSRDVGLAGPVGHWQSYSPTGESAIDEITKNAVLLQAARRACAQAYRLATGEAFPAE